VFERETDLTHSIQNLCYIIWGGGGEFIVWFMIFLKLCGSVENVSKLFLIAPKLRGICGSEQQDCTYTGPGDHIGCCTMDIVTLQK
jgi:hypothetical protein